MRSVESDRVLEEHRELRVTVGELQAMLARVDTSQSNPGQWVAELTQSLVLLHDRVCRHFRSEEECGILVELGEAHPRALPQVQSLMEQHAEILSGLRALVGETMIGTERRADGAPGLRSRVRRVLDLLARHERAETTLITELVYQDLGTAD